MAVFLALTAVNVPTFAQAETFIGKEFLEWSEAGQNSYIQSSVTMGTLVATRTNQPMATCLDNWYATSDALSEQRNAYIRDKISKNSEFHPSAVIVLVLEEACGSFLP